MSIRTPFRTGKAIALATVLFCTSALTGCASFFTPVNNTTTGSNNGTGDFVYVGKNGSSSLAAYQIGTGGSLTALTGTGFSISSSPTALAISPNNNFLYVGTTGGFFGYSISSSGTISALNGGMALASSFPVAAMDISADGNWLVVISSTPSTGAGILYPLSSVTGLIGSGAQLTAPATGIGQAVQFASNEASATTSTIAASFGTAGVYLYTFNTNTTNGGSPTFISPALIPSTAPANASDNGLIWNSAGTAIFFVGGGTDQTLYGFPVNSATGVFSNGTGITTGVNPTALTFDATGAFIYVTNQGTSGVSGTPGTTISGYSVTSNSGVPAFSVLSSSTFSSSGSGPGAIINAGPYVMVVDQTGPPDLVLYSVDSTNPGRIFVTSSETTGLTATASTTPSVVIAATN